MMTDRALFTLGSSSFIENIVEPWDLEIIDVLHYNNSDYLRVRNYKDAHVSIRGGIQITP